ncbi:hypothetical protein AAD018_006145 [Aestuariibius insulae]|uniref:hypothetical protein n=1 Tax=Aestuariibius insulae TaxID=2058287 RepID=UPI00345ECAF7
MEIAYHIGANCTDDDRLMKALMKNADPLLKAGIAVPGPSRYRGQIREAVQILDGAPAAPGARDALIEEIFEKGVDQVRVKRLVMSNWRFLCVPRRIFENGVFYEQATPKVRGLAEIFSGDDLHLYFALRNPATFVPVVLEAADGMPYRDLMNGLDPRDLMWSDVIERIRVAAPAAQLTVWCNEDTPFIWPALLRDISNIDAETEIEGELDLLDRVLTAEGRSALRARLAKGDVVDIDGQRALLSEVLSQHADPKEVEQMIDIPGWSQALVDELTATYEADVARILQMPGVRFVLP